MAAFEQANPGITVQVENSEFSSYWDKLATQTAGNDPPDVIQMDEAYIAAYGGRDALLDLSTQSSVLDLSAMDAKVLDTGKVGDTLVGAPVGVALFSVGVNPELLKQAGLEIPDDKTWTWDDLPPWPRPSPRSWLRRRRRDGLLRPQRRGDRCLGSPAQPEVFPIEGQTAVTEETLVSFFEFAKRMVEMRRPRRLAARSRTHQGAGRQPVRYEHGRVPPAVPYPDCRVRRRQRERSAVAEAARAGLGGIAADGQQGVDVLVAGRQHGGGKRPSWSSS